MIQGMLEKDQKPGICESQYYSCENSETMTQRSIKEPRSSADNGTVTCGLENLNICRTRTASQNRNGDGTKERLLYRELGRPIEPEEETQKTSSNVLSL
jgi:hypothetical protein